ncbi:hypothetical protein LINGRAHAP2_LOCUS12537, partial [Linum grandiflorum]
MGLRGLAAVVIVISTETLEKKVGDLGRQGSRGRRRRKRRRGSWRRRRPEVGPGVGATEEAGGFIVSS